MAGLAHGFEITDTLIQTYHGGKAEIHETVTGRLTQGKISSLMLEHGRLYFEFSRAAVQAEDSWIQVEVPDYYIQLSQTKYKKDSADGVDKLVLELYSETGTVVTLFPPEADIFDWESVVED